MIFRTLSVLTLLEGSVGFLVAADSIAMGPFSYKALQHLEGQNYPSAVQLIYFITIASLVFCLLLLYVGRLLWKLRRRGLSALIYVLAAEFFYSLIFITTVMSTHSFFRAPSKGYAFILGMGLMPFAIQVVTAFPIISGVLIFFGYRYLGIPARPTE